MSGMLLATLEAMVSATGRWRTNIWQQSWVSLTTLPLVWCFPPPSQGKGRKLVRFVHPELRTKTKLGCSVHPRGFTIKGYTDSSRLLKFPGRPMFLLDWTSLQKCAQIQSVNYYKFSLHLIVDLLRSCSCRWIPTAHEVFSNIHYQD